MSHGRWIPVSPPVHRPTGRSALRDGWTAVLLAALVVTWAVVAFLATTLVWLIVAYESPSALEDSLGPYTIAALVPALFVAGLSTERFLDRWWRTRPARPAGIVAAAGVLFAAAAAAVFIWASLAR
jgi:hypothetical protein